MQSRHYHHLPEALVSVKVDTLDYTQAVQYASQQHAQVAVSIFDRWSVDMQECCELHRVLCEEYLTLTTGKEMRQAEKRIMDVEENIDRLLAIKSMVC